MNKYSGSNFDDFLEEEGILEEVTALAQDQLEKPDNFYGFKDRFLQWLQFKNQFVICTASICALITIGVYFGSRYFYGGVDDTAEETHKNGIVPMSVEPTLVEGVSKEVKVSPFGFGAFPKIPADFPDQDIWNKVEKRSISDPNGAETLELLARVRIELWNQGKRTKGVIMDSSNGLIYSDSNIEIFFPLSSDLSSDLPKYNTYFDEDFNLSERIDVKFLEGGIDPYEFLNLRR